MFEYNVFKRARPEGAVVSSATYNLFIGLVLCWGLLVNWLIVRHINPVWILSIDFRLFLLLYFASCFFGVYLFNKSADPAISFIGYNFVVVPFGLVLDLIVSRYEPGLVLQAIQVTAMVTIVMMVLGSLFPRFFRSIYRGLVIALLAVIIIELIQIFIFKMHSGWIDWVVVLIFCGYIGFDWGRANRIPKTVDNAVDSAAAIYMDVINLFVRILSILKGRRR